MEKKSSVGFVSFSAFIHAALLLGLAIIPAMKLLPSDNTVEIVTESGVSPISAISTATTVTPEPAAASSQPEPQSQPATELPAKKQTLAKPEPIVAPKPVAAIKPKKISAAKKVVMSEGLEEKKSNKKVVAIDPSQQDLESDVAAAQEEAESFAKEQKIKPAKEEAPAVQDDPEDEVVNTAVESAASEAVAKQQVNEKQIENKVEKELPAPKTQPAVQKLSEIKESNNEASGLGADMGAVAGPSSDELRSYLDLKQLSGNKPPQYPTLARRLGQQGQVLLNYYVTQQGTVKDVRIAKSSGFNELDREAVRAAGQLRFVAGQEGWTSHPVVFSLKGQAMPAASRLRTAGSTNNRSE